MASITYCLVHGAWHGAWCWEELVPELRARGCGVVVPDLRCDDPAAGLERYAQTVVAAVEEAGAPWRDVVVVGHSFGGVTLPVVGATRPVRRLVYLAALVPWPGRPMTERFAAEDDIFTPDWGAGIAKDELGRSLWVDPAVAADRLYNRCTPRQAGAAFARLRPQGQTAAHDLSAVTTLTGIPRASIVCRDDRCINPEWSRRVALEELRVDPIELDADHSPFLSSPVELAETLLALEQE